MLEINKLSESLSGKWEELKLFYPLKNNILEIRETNSSNVNLLFVKLENIPNECWVFESEFYMQNNTPKQKNKPLEENKGKLQHGSLSSAGQKVEKIVIWEEDKRLRLLLIEMKTDLTFKNVSECIYKINESLNTFCVFLAAHYKYRNMEKYLSPMGLICYNHDGCQEEKTDYLGETGNSFKKAYLDANLRDFPLKIEPFTLKPMIIPISFRKNMTSNKEGFNLDFNEIYQKLIAI